MAQLQLISAPETLASPTLAHRFLVELASTETELDSQGILVPVMTKIVDVCVLEPNSKAITALLEATGNLKGLQIKSYWVPEDGCPF